MRRAWPLLSAAGFLLLGASPAYADGATPLVLTETAHLLIGNALIGVLEGVLLAWLFQVGRGRAVKYMIGANYFSMAAGFFVTSAAYHFLLRPLLVGAQPLYHQWRAVLAIFPLSFVATVVLEWPFCYWLLLGQENRFRRAWKATLVAQAASYAILLPLYGWVSQKYLLLDLKPDPTLLAEAPADATVFFISPDDKSLLRVSSNGEGLTKVMDLPGKGYLALSGTAGGAWDLQLEYRGGTTTLIPRLAANPFPDEQERSMHWGKVYPSNYFLPYDLRPQKGRKWSVRHFHWSLLMAESQDQTYPIAMEMPLDAWFTSGATMLPKERAIFEFGRQIVLLDVASRRIAWLANGTEPIVLLNESLRPPPATATAPGTLPASAPADTR